MKGSLHGGRQYLISVVQSKLGVLVYMYTIQRQVFEYPIVMGRDHGAAAPIGKSGPWSSSSYWEESTMEQQGSVGNTHANCMETARAHPQMTSPIALV